MCTGLTAQLFDKDAAKNAVRTETELFCEIHCAQAYVKKVSVQKTEMGGAVFEIAEGTFDSV